VANFVKHTRCPECSKRGRDKAGNNLGVYDDGSYYCFLCGYNVNGNNIQRFKLQNLDSIQSKERASNICIPEDADTYLPAVARMWLGKYGITEYELVANRLLWSEYWQQLIFPYFDKYNNLVAWQGRSFAKGRSKWFSQGNLKKLYHILPPREFYERIVLVEDIVSAIKLARVVPTLPVMGSQIQNERFMQLSKLTKEVVIWLDPDMRKASVEFSRKANMFGLKSTSIFSEVDPKELEMDKIKILLDI
jgi:hypothetical protein